jgi:hypothetical protein
MDLPASPDPREAALVAKHRNARAVAMGLQHGFVEFDRNVLDGDTADYVRPLPGNLSELSA